MKTNIRLYAVLIISALGMIIIVQNTTVVEVRLLFWSVVLSRALLIVLLILLGFIVGWLLRGHFAHRTHRKS
jgi:uncharacterized integral membrane protein